MQLSTAANSSCMCKCAAGHSSSKQSAACTHCRHCSQLTRTHSKHRLWACLTCISTGSSSCRFACAKRTCCIRAQQLDYGSLRALGSAICDCDLKKGTAHTLEATLSQSQASLLVMPLTSFMPVVTPFCAMALAHALCDSPPCSDPLCASSNACVVDLMPHCGTCCESSCA